MTAMTQIEKDKIRDDAIAKWWDDWWEADYSWEGLASKQWQGWLVIEDKAVYDVYFDEHGLPLGCPNKVCQVIPKTDLDKLPDGTIRRDATLQDYWRDQESNYEIDPVSGKKFLTPFIPPYWKNGEATWKANLFENELEWGNLNKIITERVNHGRFTPVEIKGIEREVFHDIDKRAQLNGCCIANCSNSKTYVHSEEGVLVNIIHVTARQAFFFRGAKL